MYSIINLKKILIKNFLFPDAPNLLFALKALKALKHHLFELKLILHKNVTLFEQRGFHSLALRREGRMHRTVHPHPC